MPTPCIDCGAPVIRKSRNGPPPLRYSDCRRERLRELSRRSTNRFMDRHPERGLEAEPRGVRAGNGRRTPRSTGSATGKWQAANTEKAREAYRQWRAANPEKAREAERRSVAKRRRGINQSLLK